MMDHLQRFQETNVDFSAGQARLRVNGKRVFLLTMAHFVIDAGAWRLTKPSTRAYVKDRFGFVFRDDAAGMVPAPSGTVSPQA